MKSFHLSTEANLDIEEIANYIFDLNPVAAYRFLDDLDETFELLADFPLIGRLRPDLATDVRSYPVGNYLVFYVPAGKGIEITRVIYGGRDLTKAFKR
jgi:toxin ParE1/3/4